jgi:hypothetical protein
VVNKCGIKELLVFDHKSFLARELYGYADVRVFIVDVRIFREGKVQLLDVTLVSTSVCAMRIQARPMAACCRMAAF